jgi:hypothetical protein
MEDGKKSCRLSVVGYGASYHDICKTIEKLFNLKINTLSQMRQTSERSTVYRKRKTRQPTVPLGTVGWPIMTRDCFCRRTSSLATNG